LTCLAALLKSRSDHYVAPVQVLVYHIRSGIQCLRFHPFLLWSPLRSALRLNSCMSADVEEIYGEELYPIEKPKKLCAEVIRGVAYVHSCGVVHGGKWSDP
jgi:hypothetical protein